MSYIGCFMKKVFKFIFIIISLLFITKVHADTTDVSLVGVSLIDKSDTVVAEDVVLNGNSITSNITFNEQDDYIEYEFTFKNTGDDKYKIVSIEDNNENDNISIEYKFNSKFMEKNQTNTAKVKMIYSEQLLNTEKISLSNLTIKFNLEREDGSSSRIVVNPTTGDSILHYLVLLIIALIGLILIVIKKKNKIGAGLLIAATVLIPFAAIANEKYDISVKFTNIDIMGKILEPEDYAILLDGTSFRAKLPESSGAFREATSSEYEAIANSLTENNIISTDDSPKVVYMWKSGRDMVYYSDAGIVYMNEDCSGMFNSTTLDEIDLSPFDTSRIINTNNMFNESESLATIFVSRSWDISEVQSSQNMFKDCLRLIGELETVYDANHIDKGYGHIDEGESNPGYLTLKGHYRPAYLISGNDFHYALERYNDSTVNFRKATDSEYNAVRDSLTDDNIVSLENSTPVYLWQNGEDTLYYSKASKIYMNPNASSMFSDEEFVNIDLSGFDSSLTTDMSSMFISCSNLVELDISSFISDNIKNITYTFAGCASLETIYVNEDWHIEYEYESIGGSYDYAVTTDIDYYELFRDCNKLVGEQGTSYVDIAELFSGEEIIYATIDEGPLSPGLFTVKGHTKTTTPKYALLKSGNEFNSTLYNIAAGIGEDGEGDGSYGSDDDITNEYKYFREATEAEYNEVKDTLTENNIISTSKSPNVYAWGTGDSILYYSEKETIYMNPDSGHMFMFTNFVYIDLSGLDSGAVKSMYETFYEVSNLVEVDLSSFDTSNVVSMEAMFSYCANLMRIYVSDKWTTDKIPEHNDLGMFSYTPALIGGMGTVYNDEYTDKTYAHIDGGPSNPGYLTVREDIDRVHIISGTEFNNKLKELDTSGKHFRPATETEYNNAKNSLTDENIISRERRFKAYMWVSGNNILYYSDLVMKLDIDSSHMFADTGLVSIDLTGFNTTGVEDMSHMFENCESLTEIIFENSDSGVSALPSNNLSASIMDASNNNAVIVIAIIALLTILVCAGACILFINRKSNKVQITVGAIAIVFIVSSLMLVVGKQGFSKLMAFINPSDSSNTAITATFDTSKVRDMSSMFYNCTSLTELDLSSFDLSRISYGDYMFYNCSSLRTIYVSEKWFYIVDEEYSTQGIENASLYDMFYGCVNLVGEKGTAYEDNENIYGYGQYRARVDEGYVNPGYLTLKGHTPSVNDYAVFMPGYDFNARIHAQFEQSYYFGSEYEPEYDSFRPATTAEYNAAKNSLTDDNIFSDENSPSPIYIWNVGRDLVYYSEAEIIYLNVHAVEMFSGTDFKSIDLSSINTSATIEMNSMFYNCENLTSLDLSSFDTNRVESFRYMFEECHNLESINLSSFDTKNATEMESMFRACESLTELDLSSFDTRNVTNTYTMFADSPALRKIYVSEKWSLGSVYGHGMFDGCPSLVGGAGTTFDSNYIDESYAHIDGGSSNPGYFTNIADKQ